MKFFDVNQEPIEKPEDAVIHWRISGYPLVIKDGKILTVTSTWNPLKELPGGGIEIGESIAEGVVRECYEESGYRIELGSNIPIHVGERNFYSDIDEKFYQAIILIYPARLLSDEQDESVINTVVENEIEKVEWIKLTDLTKEQCIPIIWPAIEKQQNGQD